MKHWRISYTWADGTVAAIIECDCAERPTYYAHLWMSSVAGSVGYSIELVSSGVFRSCVRSLLLWGVAALALFAACVMTHPVQQVAHSSLALAAAPVPVTRVIGSCHTVMTTSVSVQEPSSLCPAFIDHVLSLAGSPAAGLGQDIYTLSTQYNVDDAYTLAFYAHESTFGRLGAAAATKSWGNINCTPGWPSCIGRFRAYPSIQAGLEDYLRLLTQVYFPAGRTTAATIIPMYAPTADNNNEAAYIGSVNGLVRSWRAGNAVI